MDFLDLVRERYSLRKMSDEKISNDDLLKILEASRVAPTARNRQEQRILVINSDEGIDKLRECTGYHFNSKTILVISYEKLYENGCETEESKRFGMIDVGIVVTHLTLEATNLGIGSTIVGIFDKEKLKHNFNIPDNYEPVLLLPLGYPSEGKGPSHLHGERYPLDKTVSYNSY